MQSQGRTASDNRQGDKMSAQPKSDDYEVATITAISYRTAPATLAAVEQIAAMKPAEPLSVPAYRYRITHGSRQSSRLTGL